MAAARLLWIGCFGFWLTTDHNLTVLSFDSETNWFWALGLGCRPMIELLWASKVTRCVSIFPLRLSVLDWDMVDSWEF